MEHNGPQTNPIQWLNRADVFLCSSQQSNSIFVPHSRTPESETQTTPSSSASSLRSVARSASLKAKSLSVSSLFWSHMDGFKCWLTRLIRGVLRITESPWITSQFIVTIDVHFCSHRDTQMIYNKTYQRLIVLFQHAPDFLTSPSLLSLM